MTETEFRARFESDANADPDRAGLESSEVTSLIKDWFYVSGEFNLSLADPLTSRYCRAVAAGYRKRQGKAADPLKFLNQNSPVETSSLFTNLVTAEKRWLDAADRFDEDATRTANSTTTTQGTTTRRVSISF